MADMKPPRGTDPGGGFFFPPKPQVSMEFEKIKKEKIIKLRIVTYCLFYWVFIATTFLLIHPAGAETMVQSNVDSRVIVALQVSTPALQKWLPKGWLINTAAQGPFKDANLFVIFMDRPYAVDASGKPSSTGNERFVVLVVPVANPKSDKPTYMVIGGYSTNPEDIPGPYKNFKKASVRRVQALDGNDMEPGMGDDAWTIQIGPAGTIELRFKHKRSTPARSKVEQHIYSSIDPGFYRIYRVDQTTDLIKSVPINVDNLQNYQFKVKVPELQDMFDGSEKLVALIAQPLYIRQVFLP
jgi:hypothetical protein